jgi:uncharacterized membrane protein (DUF485 family)
VVLETSGSRPSPGPAGAEGGVHDDRREHPGEVYRRIQDSAEFQELRRGYRGLAFPVTAAFLGWYLLYILASTAAPQLMATRVYGHITVAVVAGLAQFASTFLICAVVARRSAATRDGKALELRWRAQEDLR